jgi:hypothetical protein
LTLAIGAALIIHPKLGTSVRANSGETRQDFITAMFAGGSSISIVGASNFSPQTDAFRIIYLFNSLIGVSVTSLTLTYLMQVYSALHRRNTLGLNLHLASSETADAAELVARLGPEGKFETSYSTVAQLATALSAAKESHHFYPVLFYFRFPEPYYSISRSTLLSLDTATLIKSTLSDKKFGWLKQSEAVEHLWSASTLMLETITDTFLKGARPSSKPPETSVQEVWRRRYFAAVRRLQRAGIQTTEDERAGADIYVDLRSHWQEYISMLAPRLGYSMDEIDPATNSPQKAQKQESEIRAYAAGKN